MESRGVVDHRWTPVVLMGIVTLAVVVPWVDVDSAAASTSVTGVEIPVVGVATVLLCSLGLLLGVLGALRRSGWLWIALCGVAGVIVTIDSLWLITLDVIDSSVARAIHRSLPESVRDTSPTLAADLGLWMYLILGAALCVLSVRRALEDANGLSIGTPGAAPADWVSLPSAMVEEESIEFWDD